VVQPEVSPPPAAWCSLVRPGVFTVLFTGASLGGCAVWQYENMRRVAMERRTWWGTGGERKTGVWREELRQWWASLGPGERLFWPLCGLNLLVFAAWRLPVLQPFMTRWFLCGPAQASCLPMILSAFSHYGSLHLLCNMMVLHSFMGHAVHLLGPEQFLAVYLSAGVLSSMASLTYKVATRQSSPLPLVELQRGLALIGRELHDIANTLMPRISEDVQS